jgi:hypothetical protein
MATCSYCQQRKGKRTCPALGAMICAPCCGRHRLQEIDCPSDCTYLGGLSVVRDPAKATAGFTRAEYETTWEKLHTYAQGASAFRIAALGRCFVSFSEPEPWEMDLATGYLYYGHRDADGRRLIDHFLTACGRGLSPGEAAAVVVFQSTWASLFEVVSVQTGIGLELRDLVSGEIVAVRADSTSRELKKQDVLFMWLMVVSDHVELTGAGCQVARQHLDGVREALEAELPRARRAHPGVPDRDLVGSIAWAAIRELRDGFVHVDMPVLHTSGSMQAPEVALRDHRERGEAVDFAALRREIPLDPSDEPAALHYSTATAPEPAEWLALDDTVKVEAVEQHHRLLATHPNVPNTRLHALMHVIVENQLASGDPPEVQETLERFSQAGRTRHEAIHAIGSVMAEAIWNITRNKTAFDRDAAVRALARLQPDV